MVESYIPMDTNIVCTNQTIPTPLKIWQQRENAATIHDAKDKVLLNIEDKRVSASFECVVPGLFWGGLQCLLAGIMIGALIVAAIAATVLTGGLAAVAIGVALVAGAGSIFCGIKALLAINGACGTAESEASMWMFPHQNVTIEGTESYALLNRSILKCNNGGIISLIIDDQLAKDAAKEIGDHNMTQFYVQMGSQFLMGLIGQGTSGSIISQILNPIISVISYCVSDEDDSDEADYMKMLSGIEVEYNKKDAILGGIRDDSIEQGISMVSPSVVYGAGQGTKLVSKEIGKKITEEAISELKGNFFIGFKNSLKAEKAFSIAGIVGFLANMGIGIVAEIWKGTEELKAIGAAVTYNFEDRNNEIGVLAVDA